MGDFKLVKLIDPIIVQTNGVNASITGNTSGTPALISSGTMVLSGGNNITLSQNGNSIGIIGGAGAGAGAALSAGTQSVGTGTVSFANSNGITFGMSGSNTITASHNGLTSQSVQTQNLMTVNGTQGNVTISGGNGVTVGNNASTITLSVNTNYQAPGAYLTTARASNDAIGLNTAVSNATITANSSGLSIDGRGYAGTGTTGTNATFTLNSNGLQLNAGAYLTTARASNDAIGLNTAQSNVTWTANSAGLSLDARGYAGTNTATTGNISVTLNSSGLSLNAPTFLTTAAQSNHSHGDPTLALTNLTGTTASASNGLTLSLSAANPSAGVGIAAGTRTATTANNLLFDNANGVTFGLDNVGGSVMTASHNGLTSQSNQALSGSNGSFTFQTATFGNLNGLSFYSSNGSIVGSHNGLTTARASNDAVGLNTAQTNVTWTVNSAGISLNAGAYLTTAMASNRGSDFVQAGAVFNGTNASGTIASNAISVSVAPPTAGVGVVAGTRTATTAGSILFDNANGVTFGLNGNGSSIMTASHDGLTSQSNQALSGSNGSFTFQTATLGNLNGMSFYTSNGSVVGSYTVPTVTNSSFSIQDSATTINPVARIAFSTGNNITLTLSTGASSGTVGVSHNLAGISTGFGGNLISGSMTHNSSGLNLSLNHPAWLTTAAQSSASNVSGVIAATASNAATNQTAQLSGAISFSNTNGVSFYTTASGAVSGIGATVKTDYLTTAMASNRGSDFVQANAAFAGTNASGTIASNGISVSVNAGGGGGAAVSLPANGASRTSGGAGYSNITSGTANLFGNNLTLSQDGASITFSANAPGAAAENNWINLLGANTSGNTTASGSTIGVSGINLTLSGTNGSVYNISAPATSSLSATGQVSISTNGSTISIGVPNEKTLSYYNPQDAYLQVAGQQGQGTLHIQPMQAPNVQYDRLMMPIINTNSSNSSGSHTISFWAGVYTRNDSTLSLLHSASTSTAVTHSGTAGSYSLMSGMRLLSVGYTQTLTAGQYWMGIVSRTTSGGTNGSYSQVLASQVNSSFFGHFGSSVNQSMQYTRGLGIYTATTSAMPASIAFTQISGASNSLVLRQPIFYFVSGTV